MPASAILQDMSLCMECHSCRVACQMQNGLSPERTFASIKSTDLGTYPNVAHHAIRLACEHCADAACVTSCPVTASYKGDSGLTHYNPDICIGCGNCVDECPFQVPTLVNHRTFRCNGCESLTESGKPPVCADTCISGAISYGKREDQLAKAEKRVAALKKAWPNAQVYSPAGVKGTGLIWVLRDKPEVYGLPVAPRNAWIGFDVKETLAAANPVSMAGSLVTAGLGWVLMRRMGKGEK